MRIFPKRSGDPIFTAAQLRGLLIPLIIEQLFVAAVGTADTIMVAQVGEAAMSGVSLVDSINMLLHNIFAALAVGGTIVTSQFLGRKAVDSACESAKQALVTVTSLAVIISVSCFVFRRPILSFVYGSIDEDVMTNAVSYFAITVLSYPGMMIFSTSASIFRATGNAKLPMKVSLIMNLINVSGNAFLIFVMGWGAVGAAVATLIARCTGGAIMFIKLRNPRLEVNVSKLFPYKPNIPMIKNILAVGVPTGIENGIFQIGRVLVQSIMSAFGTTSIAAAAAAHSLISIAIMPGVSVGMALVTVAGRCVGAGRYDQARRYTVGFIGLAYLSYIVLNTVSLIFQGPILSIFNLSPETVVLAKQLVMINIVGLVTLWPPAFTTPNALRAANDAKFTMIVSISSMWMFRVGLGYLLSGPLGVVGIWYGMMADWLFRAIVYMFRFYSDRWTKHTILAASVEEKSEIEE